ncbi:helix-turn-helix domain-containing protein [Nonomuraea turkmeniaca]|uniref:Helix-turn-helix domain-containing protein n=1 Tax=Nonomuraea turkmeniaca TaxID=103838 RepID=A0A5S4F284_9ACTN|nr:helix-turn-helix domain-containing protein [Nonomuraea turkmeniaca]TMR10093.1 helix-turn-helix domain-containing protein [Nonomuraea turkmeniaca]
MTTATSLDMVTVRLPRAQAHAIIQLADAATALKEAMAAPSGQTALPVPGPAAGRVIQDRASAAATREQILAMLNRAGTSGLLTADIAGSIGGVGRTTYALGVLENNGLIFRLGVGLVTWYSATHRLALIAELLNRLPNHDLTMQEAGDVLGLGTTTIRTLLDTNRLSSRRVGNSLMLYRDSVADFIRRIGSTEDA